MNKIGILMTKTFFKLESLAYNIQSVFCIKIALSSNFLSRSCMNLPDSASSSDERRMDGHLPFQIIQIFTGGDAQTD